MRLFLSYELYIHVKLVHTFKVITIVSIRVAFIRFSSFKVYGTKLWLNTEESWVIITITF
jgi:hypothetical protein